MKKIARITGVVIVTIVAACWLFIIIVSIFEGEKPTFDWESLGVIVLSLLTIFAAVTAGHNHLFAVLVAGGPLILAAILMILGMKKSE